MKANISFRPFTTEDAEQVFELLQDVSAYLPDPSKVLELGNNFANQKHSYACVALHGGRVVGFGSLFVLSRIRGGRSAIIEDMAVSFEVRGQGVGRSIVEYLLVQARKEGCFKVSLESSEMAAKFYRALGFEIGGNVMKYHL
jgi:GNAT superfamily N-acetyltransferase